MRRENSNFFSPALLMVTPSRTQKSHYVVLNFSIFPPIFLIMIVIYCIGSLVFRGVSHFHLEGRAYFPTVHLV
jgi:hypothetical protein